MTMLRKTLAAAALALALGVPAQAAVGPEDQALLGQIETYLNGITTMQARFTQISQTEGLAEGDLYLSRPGRMRIEYDPPSPYLYVADGFWLTFYDAELDQRSDALLGETLADFVTRANVRLSGDVTVTDVRQRNGQVEVDIVQASKPNAGALTLFFTESPLTLIRWNVTDAQGVTTEVWLNNPSFGVALSGDLFVAPRPGRGR